MKEAWKNDRFPTSKKFETLKLHLIWNLALNYDKNPFLKLKNQS